MDIRSIIDQSLARVNALKSYRCLMDLYSWKKKEERAQQLVVYRAPGDLRIEQLGPWKKGAVVVIRSDGKIRARGGGLLSFFKVELDRDSDLLLGITGDSAVDSDWAGTLLKFEKMVPYVVKAVHKSIIVNSLRGFDVVAHLQRQPFDKARFILRSDGPVLLLERFQENKLLNRVVWKDIQLNIKVVDADFGL